MQDITETELREVNHQQKLEDIVPRFKHSAKYSELLNPYKNVYHQLLPAFHPNFKRKKHLEPQKLKTSNSIINYVTPLSSEKTTTSEVQVSTEKILKLSEDLMNPSISVTKMLVSTLVTAQDNVNGDVDEDLMAMEISEHGRLQLKVGGEEEEEVKESSKEELLSRVENSSESEVDGSGDEETSTDVPNINQLLP